jgi:molybdopterin synthase catalytic subunit
MSTDSGKDIPRKGFSQPRLPATDALPPLLSNPALSSDKPAAIETPQASAATSSVANHDPMALVEPNIHVSLTDSPLDPLLSLSHVKRPTAGANVLFSGTTRNNFDSRPVSNLTYQAYPPLALRTMQKIARNMLEKHKLEAISIIHRLGEVPICEESILIALSAPHRTAAWRAGEECLELVKEKVEVWKLEVFGDGEGVWRANRDGQAGVKVGEEGEGAQAQKALTEGIKEDMSKVEGV